MYNVQFSLKRLKNFRKKTNWAANIRQYLAVVFKKVVIPICDLVNDPFLTAITEKISILRNVLSVPLFFRSWAL